jgi:hypothetical protein
MHHVYLMTHQTYKDELSTIKHIESDLKIALSFVRAEIVANSTEVELDNGGKAYVPFQITRVLRQVGRYEDILSDIVAVRSYRSRLAAWFNGSRLGNPPSLR